MNSPPLTQIAVGVVVERRKADSPWIDFVWRAVGTLPDAPDMQPWTILREEDDAVLFYAGSKPVNLYRSETARYRDNLATGSPNLWVVLSPTEQEWPYTLTAVTADPAEVSFSRLLLVHGPLARTGGWSQQVGQLDVVASFGQGEACERGLGRDVGDTVRMARQNVPGNRQCPSNVPQSFVILRVQQQGSNLG